MLLSGTLADLDLAGIAAMTSLGRTSLRLELRESSGDLIGSMVLKAGRVVSATAGGMRGRDALRVIMGSASDTRFELAHEPLDFVLSSALASVDELRTLARGTTGSTPIPERAIRDTDAVADDDGARREGTLSLKPGSRLRAAPPGPARVAMMQGRLDEFDLVTLLLTIGVGRQLVEIEVRDRAGMPLGTVRVKSGKLVSAHAGDATGVAAVSALSRAAEGFEFAAYRVAAPAEQLRELASVAELGARLGSAVARPAGPPPTETRDPRHRADRLVMEGSLSDFDLPTLLHTIGCSRQHCALQIADGPAIRGTIGIKSGIVVSAIAGSLTGIPAIRQLIAAPPDDRFRLVQLTGELPDAVPLGPVGHVLLQTDAPAPPPRAPTATRLPTETRPPTATATRPPTATGIRPSTSTHPPTATATRPPTATRLPTATLPTSTRPTATGVPAPSPDERAAAGYADGLLVMEGRLADFDLRTVLEVLAATRQHARLQVLEAGQPPLGEITVKAGWILSSQAGALRGHDALRFLLAAPPRLQFRVLTVAETVGGPAPIGQVHEVLVGLPAARPVGPGASTRILRWAIPISFALGGAIVFLVTRGGTTTRAVPLREVPAAQLQPPPAEPAAPSPAAPAAAAPAASAASAAATGPTAAAPAASAANAASAGAPSQPSTASPAPAAASAPPAEPPSRSAASAAPTEPPPARADEPRASSAPPDDASPPTGMTIRTAQTALKQLGHDPGAIDGVLGHQTRTAILRFQRAQHLRATGVLDPETWSAIAAQLMVRRAKP